MFLEKLKIFNFRNIVKLEEEFKKHIVVFEGQNGQGKTNLAEAICLLSKGKSFRTQDLEHLPNKNDLESGCSVFGLIDNQKNKSEVEIKIENFKKNHQINQKKISSLKAFKKFPTIIFSPESLSAIKEGPEARRILIDETLVLEDDANIQIINQFKKAQKSKNLILRRYKQGLLSQHQAKDILGGLNPVFAKSSLELSEARQKLIKGITERFQDTFQGQQQKNVEISVNYVASNSNTARHNQDEFITRELNSGQILEGAHKDDIVFSFENQNSRFYCSQGQQRALILAFKFTQILYHKAIYGYYPILILDDVLSEFDREKRSFLIQFLNKNEAQTFITTTDLEEFKNSRSTDICVLNVLNGTVKKFG